MSNKIASTAVWAILGSAILVLNQPALAKTTPVTVSKKAGIVEKLNQQVDLSLTFREENGSISSISDLMLADRPSIIVPVYYSCPNLCSITLSGVSKMLDKIELELGADFNLLAVSIDPTESSETASKWAKKYHEGLKEPSKGKLGWRFLTGEQKNITPLMKQLGFIYEKDGKDYSHTAALMVLTPAGNVSRYFYGVEYNATDVKYSLVEAAKGKIGSTLDRVFLYCFTYDSSKGKYTPLIWNFIRVICIGGVVLLALLLVFMWRRERRGQVNV